MFWFARKLMLSIGGERKKSEGCQDVRKPGETFWLNFERGTLVLSAIASIVAVGGVASWFFEKDARSLDRASKVFDATSGAYEMLKRAKGVRTEIGQTEAFNYLSAHAPNLENIELDELTFTGAIIRGPLASNNYSRITFWNTTVDLKADGRDDESENDGIECSYNLNSNGVVFGNFTRLTTSCLKLKSNAVLFQTNFKGKDIYLIPHIISEDDIFNLPDGMINTRMLALNGKLDPEYATALPGIYQFIDSDMSHMHLHKYGGQIQVISSDMSHSNLEISGQANSFIGSVFTGSKFAYKSEYSAYDWLKIVRVAGEEVRDLMVHDPKLDRYKSGGRSGKIAGSFDSTLNPYGFLLNLNLAPIISIYQSDIRGADLSSIPPDFLILKDVCADSTTRLPAGVRITECAPTLSDYWNNMERGRKQGRGFGLLNSGGPENEAHTEYLDGVKAIVYKRPSGVVSWFPIDPRNINPAIIPIGSDAAITEPYKTVLTDISLRPIKSDGFFIKSYTSNYNQYVQSILGDAEQIGMKPFAARSKKMELDGSFKKPAYGGAYYIGKSVINMCNERSKLFKKVINEKKYLSLLNDTTNPNIKCVQKFLSAW